MAVAASALGDVWKLAALATQAGTTLLTAPAAEEPHNPLLAIRLVVPRGTEKLRFVVRDMTNGRMGTADADPHMVDGAPMIALPPPAKLKKRPVPAQP